MKILKAVESEWTVWLTVHLDERMCVRDPEQPEPTAGEPDTRPLVPDPGYVMELQWGADVPEATIERETALLAAAELAKRGGATSKVAGFAGATLDASRLPGGKA